MKTAKYLDGLKKPHEEKIFKTFTSELKVADDTKRVLTVIISTPNEDRSGDTMSMKGMQYDNFIKNPVVLFAHDYKSKPIAKCLSLQVTDRAVVATVEFAPKGLYEEADIIYELYKQGFLSAWSIGFRALDYDVNKTGGYDFTSWELFEFSSVPVPDQPQALTIMRSKGINVDKILEKQAKSEDEEVKEETEKEEPVAKETPIEEAKQEEEKIEPIEKEEVPVVEEEKKEEEKSVAEAELDETKLISELNIAQFKKLLPQEGDKSIAQEVKKDVEQVIALGYVLDTLSWFISCFEYNEVSQSSIDKLTQALGLVMQVVAEQAELGKKEFNLADFPNTKEAVKLLAKAGRAISAANKEKLQKIVGCMDEGKAHAQELMDSVEDASTNADGDKSEEGKGKEDLLKKIVNSLKTSNQQQTVLIKEGREAKSLTARLLEEINLKGGENKHGKR